MKSWETARAEGGPPVERGLKALISRTTAITGELKDSDTRQPLADFSVKLLRISWARGKRLFANQGIGSTDEKGAFRVNAPPGDYLLEIFKAPAANQIVPGRQADYSAKPPPPLRYPTAFWPGDPDTLIPLTVRSGADLDVGTIHLSKVRMGRIRGRIPLSQCTEGQSAVIGFEMDSILDNVTGGALTVSCNGGFTIANLSPGYYRIRAITLNGPGGLATTVLPGAGEESAVRRYVFGTPATANPLPEFGSAVVRIAEGSDMDLDMTFEPAVNLVGKAERE